MWLRKTNICVLFNQEYLKLKGMYASQYLPFKHARVFSYVQQSVVNSQRNHITGTAAAAEASSLIYQILSNGKKTLALRHLKEKLNGNGILWNDPRLKQLHQNIQDWQSNNLHHENETINTSITADTFLHFLKDEVTLKLFCKVFSKGCVIPNFKKFTEIIADCFETAKKSQHGKVADYIPQLAKADPESWGLSICSVDGQRFSIGDANESFCLQSCVKPFVYAIAVSDYSSEMIHRYMGQEPSGLYFNALNLNTEDKPHNPLINSGAIVVCSLIKPDQLLSERFEYVQKYLRDMCADEHVSFDNTVFLSEKQTSFQNFSIAYYLMEKNCFPVNTSLRTTLDFYLQLCAVTTTCQSAAVAASTLANGGVSPLLQNKDRLLQPASVRNTLSLMHSCGMYDYSGKFAFQVGLPAKSGVAGGLLVVIPNVMGFMCRSPLLDDKGNSVRGIEFCRELVRTFNFHTYDDLLHSVKKKDPRKLNRLLTSDEMRLSYLYKVMYEYDSETDDSIQHD
uniref:glutaminase n=1 Tax=Ciona intestinalis TaxID=7719 RepID=F6TQT4_CIOIN|nr:glutaminase kidney isoform, mitochondrial-like [Ciona intestinalis]|eukprot:XP_002126124.1 glutaminase kidney isoform, mitochondrial-like [Ciona intestinalis]